METFDENLDQEQRKRANAAKRIKILVVITVLSISARFFIKNPEPPKKALHSDKPFKALPGMLARMPASERAKLSPDMLAQLQEADRNVNLYTKKIDTIAKVTGPDLKNEIENNQKIEEKKFIYEMRSREKTLVDEFTLRDRQKSKLVMLRNGRTIKAEAAKKSDSSVEITVTENQLSARLPSTMVSSIHDNALNWEEPIPSGFLRLKPAPGITIVVAKNIAKRISLP